MKKRLHLCGHASIISFDVAMKKRLHLLGCALLEHIRMRPFFITIVACLLLIIAAILNLVSSSTSTSSTTIYSLSSEQVASADPNDIFAKHSPLSIGMPIPPRFAYLISGTKGDVNSLKRLLLAVYHPRNHYVLHLDSEAPARERVKLANFVKRFCAYQHDGNVHVVGKADVITEKGSTMIASTLHGAAILLKYSKHWDWFINLSATDYPLVTQDDLLHVFSFLPKDLNFVKHTSNLGRREYQRAKPLIIDPGLFMNKKSDAFWVTQMRALPKAFKLFKGSAWMILTRHFLEYCIVGWDNLPRTLLMYYANFVSSSESYFHTVLCNSPEFWNTTVNEDLHYILWDSPPKQHPITLSEEHFDNMRASGAAFARKLKADDPVLDRIDKELLGRKKDYAIPGGWCMGTASRWGDPCAIIGNPNILRPGAGYNRLEALIMRQLSVEVFRSNQCVVYESENAVTST